MFAAYFSIGNTCVRASVCYLLWYIIVNRAQFNLTNMGPTHHPAPVHCAVKYRVLFLFFSFHFYFFKLHYIIYNIYLRNIMCVCARICIIDKRHYSISHFFYSIVVADFLFYYYYYYYCWVGFFLFFKCDFFQFRGSFFSHNYHGYTLSHHCRCRYILPREQPKYHKV